MSIKFTEYKGLNLPEVASEVLDFWKKENIFEKSVTTREGNPAFVFFLKTVLVIFFGALAKGCLLNGQNA